MGGEVTAAVGFLLALFLFAVLCLIFGALLMKGGQVPDPDDAPVPPPPAPAPPPPPPVVPQSPTVLLRFVSGSGRRPLGEARIARAARRPVIRQRAKDGLLSVFVADRQDGDGAWIYRRVGVEREKE
jgi:hypothetical protein